MYDEKTPIDVIRNALVNDKVKEGLHRRVVEEIIDKSIEQAKTDPVLHKSLVLQLNKSVNKKTIDIGPGTVTNDQMLLNIKYMNEAKGRQLSTVSPDILTHIH